MSVDNYQNYSIGELALASGNATSAIRYYESLGLLRPARSGGGQRRFGSEALEVLRYISFAQAAGFSLREIADLNKAIKPGQPLFGHWRELAERKLVELDEVIVQAKQMKRRLRHALDCRCTDPRKCPLLDFSPKPKRDTRKKL